jgi:hypothetical protein
MPCQLVKIYGTDISKDHSTFTCRVKQSKKISNTLLGCQKTLMFNCDYSESAAADDIIR